jgi:hypothetical protein
MNVPVPVLDGVPVNAASSDVEQSLDGYIVTTVVDELHVVWPRGDAPASDPYGKLGEVIDRQNAALCRDQIAAAEHFRAHLARDSE